MRPAVFPPAPLVSENQAFWAGLFISVRSQKLSFAASRLSCSISSRALTDTSLRLLPSVGLVTVAILMSPCLFLDYFGALRSFKEALERTIILSRPVDVRQMPRALEFD